MDKPNSCLDIYLDIYARDNTMMVADLGRLVTLEAVDRRMNSIRYALLPEPTHESMDD